MLPLPTSTQSYILVEERRRKVRGKRKTGRLWGEEEKKRDASSRDLGGGSAVERGEGRSSKKRERTFRDRRRKVEVGKRCLVE